MGINIDKTIARTFIIGGALGGAAGFLFGTAFGFFNTMGFIPGVKAFAAAVLGGIGNIRGAMLGGLLLGMVEALVPTAPWSGGQSVDRASSGPTWSPSWSWCWSWSSDRPAFSASDWGGRHEYQRPPAAQQPRARTHRPCSSGSADWPAAWPSASCWR